MSTRITNWMGVLATVVGFSACMKDQQEVAQDVGIIPSTCGTAGARMQATVDGAAYCANAQLIATGDESTVMVTGVDLLGNSIILQVDTLAEGAFEINEMNNAVVYMQTGTAYAIDPVHPGTLTITAHSPTTHNLKAAFDVTLLNELDGSTRTVAGDFDVDYTIGE